jgi:hypothetical protein
LQATRLSYRIKAGESEAVVAAGRVAEIKKAVSMVSRGACGRGEGGSQQEGSEHDEQGCVCVWGGEVIKKAVRKVSRNDPLGQGAHVRFGGGLSRARSGGGGLRKERGEGGNWRLQLAECCRSRRQ